MGVVIQDCQLVSYEIENKVFTLINELLEIDKHNPSEPPPLEMLLRNVWSHSFLDSTKGVTQESLEEEAKLIEKRNYKDYKRQVKRKNMAADLNLGWNDVLL